MKILVTGANGFVGRAVVPYLIAKGHQVVALEGPHGRRREEAGASFHSVDLTARPDLASLLKSVDAVVHLAGKAHSRDRGTAAAFETYRMLNVDAVDHLAGCARRAGVKRFVLLSTIHVNGANTEGAPFSESSPPNPFGAYGRSKHEGEKRLIAAAEGGMDWCIIRPPIIVGRNAQANLAKLVKLVRSGLPLPFRALDNRRSLLGLTNLCAFIEVCIDHPKAADQLFLIADEPPVSTAELALVLAASLRRPARQFSVPGVVWKLLKMLPQLGRRMEPLSESLEIDTEKARALLGWRAPCSTASAINDAVSNYRS